MGDWRKIEEQAIAKLDRYFVDYKRPTRLLAVDPRCRESGDCSERPYDAWTAAQLDKYRFVKPVDDWKGLRYLRK